MKRIVSGFSLIELMIVVALIAILLTLAYPSYLNFIRKADRTEAQVTLQDWANRQQVWRADHPDYNAAINPSDTTSYEYTMVSTATSFTLTATALGSQAADKEHGVTCGTMTLVNDGTQGPAGSLPCWGQ
jgi:type IV pilus assembly protein PilE